MVESSLRRAPEALRHGLSNDGERQLDAWWKRLSADDRRRLVALCDRHAPALARRRLRVVGRFTEGDAAEEERAFPIDLYEYFVNHEISLTDEPRTYGICTRHPAAAQAVRAGLVPATFACPLNRPECPMRRVLALGRGRDLRFEVTVP